MKIKYNLNGTWVELTAKVDQDYNATSTNAQSGTAVAEAIEGLIPIYYSEDNIAPERDSIWCQYGTGTTDYLCFTAEEANAPLEMAGVPGAPEMAMWYSYDGDNWEQFEIGIIDLDTFEVATHGTIITLENIGDKVYFKGNNDHGFCTYDEEEGNFYPNTFIIREKEISVSGNIMYIMDVTGENNTLYDSNFSTLFYGCFKLTDASGLKLPATELAEYCYNNMFGYCTSLTSAPELPAMELAYNCYSDMFGDCTSLTTAPGLPATTLAENCYHTMFCGCTSLTTAPELPATELADNCYEGMFLLCDSLIVSDTMGDNYNKVWDIPKDGFGSANYDMPNMFAGCQGSRSTDSPNFNGVQKRYYTQNTPV